MADYTRYRTAPEDVAAAQPRRRRSKTAASKKRKFLWLKITARRRPAARHRRARRGRRRHLRALAQPALARAELQKRPNAVNTTIYDRHGELIAELHGAENRVLVPSDEIPDGHEAGHRRRRGRALLPAPRRRLPGRRARHRREPPRRRRRAGRLHHHRAVRQERLRRQRAHLHAQAPRGRARLAARGPVVQGPHPHRVPQHRVLRRRRLRRRGGGAHLLPQARLGAQPAGLRAARGAAQVPHRVRADHRPEARQGAAQHRAAAHGRPGLHHPGARRQDRARELGVYKHPPNHEQQPGRLLHRLRHPRAHQALRLAPGVRGRPQGLHEHRHDVAAGRPSTSSRAPPGRWTSASSLGGPRRHRPAQRLHPHHGRRPRLQEAEVQPGLAGAPPGGLVDEAVRAHHRRASRA